MSLVDEAANRSVVLTHSTKAKTVGVAGLDRRQGRFWHSPFISNNDSAIQVFPKRADTLVLTSNFLFSQTKNP